MLASSVPVTNISIRPYPQLWNSKTLRAKPFSPDSFGEKTSTWTKARLSVSRFYPTDVNVHTFPCRNIHVFGYWSCPSPPRLLNIQCMYLQITPAKSQKHLSSERTEFWKTSDTEGFRWGPMDSEGSSVEIITLRKIKPSSDSPLLEIFLLE